MGAQEMLAVPMPPSAQEHLALASMGASFTDTPLPLALPFLLRPPSKPLPVTLLLPGGSLRLSMPLSSQLCSAGAADHTRVAAGTGTLRLPLSA